MICFIHWIMCFGHKTMFGMWWPSANYRRHIEWRNTKWVWRRRRRRITKYCNEKIRRKRAVVLIEFKRRRQYLQVWFKNRRAKWRKRERNYVIDNGQGTSKASGQGLVSTQSLDPLGSLQNTFPPNLLQGSSQVRGRLVHFNCLYTKCLIFLSSSRQKCCLLCHKQSFEERRKAFFLDFKYIFSYGEFWNQELSKFQIDESAVASSSFYGYGGTWQQNPYYSRNNQFNWQIKPQVRISDWNGNNHLNKWRNSFSFKRFPFLHRLQRIDFRILYQLD